MINFFVRTRMSFYRRKYYKKCNYFLIYSVWYDQKNYFELVRGSEARATLILDFNDE